MAKYLGEGTSQSSEPKGSLLFLKASSQEADQAGNDCHALSLREDKSCQFEIGAGSIRRRKSGKAHK